LALILGLKSQVNVKAKITNAPQITVRLDGLFYGFKFLRGKPLAIIEGTGKIGRVFINIVLSGFGCKIFVMMSITMRLNKKVWAQMNYVRIYPN